MAERGVILSYHRVAEHEYDPFGLCLSRAAFARHLELLRDRYRVLPLTELAAGAAQGSLPPDAVAITLDDGTLDQLAASEQIAAAGLPATVFVTAIGLGKPTEPWWERLARAVRPPELGQIHRELLHLPAQPRDEKLSELLRARGVDDVVRDSHRLLTADEVRRLRVTVGAHGLEHLFLTAQDPGAQRREIEEGRRLLSDALGERVDSFAYPFGAYDATAVSLAGAAGFVAAVTTVESAVEKNSEALALPRMAAPEEVAELNRRLTLALAPHG